ncbi:ankyrin repeat-containing domain protein [Mycena maculata]|uniref:Ankyrin repeat-containing domain protein n=1 Tax=Mycena maculata TaxID=230809 RepID=A0AAD7I598_9AGAR|nr:ankyrin repeat-containing domain protein [Mycena maculata]
MAETLGIVTSVLQLVDTASKARDYIKDFHNAPAEQQKVFTEIAELIPLLTELKTCVEDSPSATSFQHIATPLDKFKTMMEHFMAKFTPPDGRLSKFSKQLTWTLWNKKEAKEYLVEFESVKSLLNTWLAVGIWDAGRAQEKEHHAILTAITEHDCALRERHDVHSPTMVHVLNLNTEQEHKQILDWITPLNFFQRQADIFSAWQPGTGGWLLSDPHFKDWESGSNTILWCRGIRTSFSPTFIHIFNPKWTAGDGKTVLSSVVVNYLRDQFQTGTTGIACIYLNHKEAETQTPENLLASLWKQLVVDKPLPPMVHNLYKHHHTRGTKPSLDEVSRILQSDMAQYSRSYFIIDALDEYPENQRNGFLKQLSILQGPTTSFLITSRPHITLDAFFPDSKELEIHATEDDICQYVDKQIESSPRLSKHVDSKPELRDEIESRLISSVQGIHKEYSQGGSAMQRIRNQNEDDKQLALLALTWVAYAKRPLSVAELQEALAIEPNANTLDTDDFVDIGLVLSACGGLIIVDDAMSVVRLIHYTTQHYFDGIQVVQFAEAHTMIASRCLGYLTFEEFQYQEFKEDEPVARLVRAHPLLAYRSCQGHTAVVQFLLEKGANVNVQGGTYGTALQAVSYTGHERVVQLLLEKGADVNVQGGFYGTPLQAASSNGHEAVVQLLIEKRANVNVQGGEYGIGLQAASYNGHEGVVQLLLKKGADVNVQGGIFGTALQAASCNGHEAVVQLLVKNRANVNVQGGIYGTALGAASVNGHEAVVKLLIEKGADVNVQGGQYGTTLQAASSNGNKAVVQLLIEKGANVNVQGGQYGTALQAASSNGSKAVGYSSSSNGNKAVVQLLLEKEADIDVPGGYFGTGASSTGNEAVVQLLIEKGADVNIIGVGSNGHQMG